MKQSKSAYAAAGVDIDEQTIGLNAIKSMVDSTKVPGVMSGIGPFGGMFRSPGRDSILVASTDGVGTKLTVARLCGIYTTVGQDIVNHCVNDILVQGAEPLFFLDYFATSKLKAPILAAVVKGICTACRQNKCALLGGETAEMSGVYARDEIDVVGTIIGHVNRRKVVTGSSIRKGDVIIGLRSSGLHTNGYTLARRALLEQAGLKVTSRLPGSSITVGKALLAVHRSYLKPVQALLKAVPVHGMAHITGGGFTDNIPRVLPSRVDAVIDCSSWKPGALFQAIQKSAGVATEEMYRVFNMGIGYVCIVPAASAAKAMAVLARNGEKPVLCGHIAAGSCTTVLENLPQT